MTATPNAEPPPCPQCGTADGVQKVSSTYVSEISTGYRGGLWGPRQTELSRLLCPPSKPRVNDLRALSLLNLGTTVCGLTLYTAVCLYSGVPLLVFPPQIILMGIPLGPGSAFLCSALMVVTPTIVGAVLVYYGYKNMRSWNDRLPLEKGRWERAIGRWERLYYCARDDGVYLPGQKTLTPIVEMEKMLYSS